MMQIVVTEYPKCCEDCFFSNFCKYRKDVESSDHYAKAANEGWFQCPHLSLVSEEVEAGIQEHEAYMYDPYR